MTVGSWKTFRKDAKRSQQYFDEMDELFNKVRELTKLHIELKEKMNLVLEQEVTQLQVDLKAAREKAIENVQNLGVQEVKVVEEVLKKRGRPAKVKTAETPLKNLTA